MDEGLIDVQEHLPGVWSDIIDMITTGREEKMKMLNGLLAEIWVNGYAQAMEDVGYIEGDSNVKS